MLSHEDRSLLERIAVQSEKLTSEVRRLRGDIMRLHTRIEPFDEDVTVSEVPVMPGFPGTPQRRWKLVDALNMLADCRREILDAERHLNAIRGVLNGIAADAISREDMKPYIVNPPRGRGGGATGS
ncbi:MAG: hypothetical protein RIB97_13150 [Nitratireductor sp.]